MRCMTRTSHGIRDEGTTNHHRGVLDDALMTIRSGLAARNISGVRACHMLARAVDEVIRQLLHNAAYSKGSPPLAVIALGGYGRREMSPQSDVDILFLSRDPEHPSTREASDAVLHGLWDLRLKVGHGTRTVDECVALSAEDPASMTTHMDARLIAGDARLAEALQRRIARLVSGAPERLLSDLAALTLARHERFGETVFLLEPNIKLGKGGLRDLHTARWAAKALFGEGEPQILASRGLLPLATANALSAARDFLLLTRTALHIEASWKTDRLTYEHQDRVAQVLDYVDAEGAADARALMTAFYHHAHVVGSTALRMLERGQARDAGAVPRVLDERYEELRGYLSSRDPDLFIREPLELVRVFRIASERGLRIHPATQERMLACSPRLDPHRGEPEAREALLWALDKDDDARTLLLMHELGVLPALLPELRPIKALFQRNLFHVYTVDIHTLYAVRQLERLRSGSLTKERPELCDVASRFGVPRSVLLAMLLHDVGKGQGGDHCERSVKAVPGVAARLDLEPAEQREIEFLVRHHLDMALLSQTRDLSDLSMIRDFARRVGTRERLARLYLVTFADMSSVNPELLNQWKSQLLHELYEKTCEIIDQGLDLFRDPQERVEAVRAQALELLLGSIPDHPSRQTLGVDHFFGGLPTRYFEATSPETIIRHMGLLSRLSTEALALELVALPERGEVEVTVVCRDTPGLLSRVAAVFAANGIDVRTAEISSRTDGLALDVFRVSDRHDRLAGDERRWRAVRAALEGSLRGPGLDEQTLLESALSRVALPAKSLPRVPPRILFDNELSAEHTIIDVEALDFRGLLYRITRVLYRLGLSISLAIVNTEGPVARDAFYVSYLSGGKVLSPDQHERIRAELLAELD